jgi:hypothetical protein
MDYAHWLVLSSLKLLHISPHAGIISLGQKAPHGKTYDAIASDEKFSCIAVLHSPE